MQGVLTGLLSFQEEKVYCWKGLATHMRVGKRKDYRSKDRSRVEVEEDDLILVSKENH